jgi:pyridoxine 5-phosphate synthase
LLYVSSLAENYFFCIGGDGLVLCQRRDQPVQLLSEDNPLMPRLGANIDHVATLREVRKGINPEPLFAALICEAAGAEAIVVHLREDRRHIKDKDLYILKQAVKVKLNLEMSVSQEIVGIACKIKPDQATLVPEKRQELTTEGGLDVVSNFKRVSGVVRQLKKKDIEVSLFIDPDEKQVDASKKSGARIIEFHTGRYANAANPKEEEKCFKEIVSAASYARTEGLRVFAGHGLDYHNVSRIAKIKGIEELNIGYAIVCRAVLVGLEKAVREMKALVN